MSSRRRNRVVPTLLKKVVRFHLQFRLRSRNLPPSTKTDPVFENLACATLNYSTQQLLRNETAAPIAKQILSNVDDSIIDVELECDTCRN